MKRTYHTPYAKKIDFDYDEQVTAASVPCNNYSQWSLENPYTCLDELKDIPVTRMYSNCIAYTDQK